MVRINKNQAAADCFVVSAGKNIYGVGLLIMGLGIFLAIAEIVLHTGPSVPVFVYPLAAVITMLGAGCLLQARNKRLEVEGSRLIHVDIRGKRQEVSLDQVGFVKAAANPEGGQDYLCVYDKEGRRLFRLAFHMENAFRFLSYLYDNGVSIDTKKDTGNYLGEIVLQQQIAEEQVKKLAAEAYEKAGKLLAAWQEKNKKFDVEFEYGLVQYHKDLIDPEVEIQPPDCHCGIAECGELPSDYLCVLEIYVKKDGCLIRDKKKQLLVMAFTLIYKYQSAAVGAAFKLCQNANFEQELEAELRALSGYLPRHKFILEPAGLGYELKHSL